MNEPIRINLRMASNTIAYLEYMQNTNAVDIRAKIEDYNLTGCTAQFYVKKPSGNVIYNSAEIDGDVVVIHPTMQMFSESGKQFGIVQIMAGNKVGASYPIAIEVKTNFIDDSAAESSNEFTALQTALQTVNKYDNRIMAVEKGLSDETRSIQRQIHTNLLNPTAPTQTVNGVTFTKNGDGTYTVNGTASTNTTFFPCNVKAEVGQWLVGCPQGGGEGKYQLGLLPDGKWDGWIAQRDSGEGSLIQNVGDSETLDTVVIVIYKGYTANNILFKPMITTDLSATYDDFVGYSGDGELNENVAEIYAAEDALQNEGYKYPIINGVKNYTDSNGVYHKNLGVVDLGTLGWHIENHSTLGQYFYASVTNLNIKRRGSFDTTLHNLSCLKYTIVKRGSSFVDKTLTVDGTMNAVTQIQIKDASYTNATDFKNAMSGVLLFYELETPQTWNSKSEISVANLFDMFHPIGSLYPTTNASFNPNTANGWRGTWERIKDCVIYAAGDSDTVGSIVGSNTHTLTTSELPSHTHSIPALSGSTTNSGDHTHNTIKIENESTHKLTQVLMQTASNGYTAVAVSGQNTISIIGGDHTHTVTTNASTTGSQGSGTAIDMRTRRLNSIVWRRVS